jgi:peptidoglycan/LPS O-acetylase OafA/YrhL
MQLITLKLLSVSLFLIICTMLVATFWTDFGLGVQETIFLPVPLIISFGLNVAGLVFSFTERKSDKLKAQIGSLGHGLLIISFIALVTYSILTPGIGK